MNTKLAITVEDISTFFNNFPYPPLNENKKFDIDKDFVDGAMPYISGRQQRESQTAPYLNIYKGFGVGTDEVRNCTILSWFMNPSETHAQGALFMEIFSSYYDGLEKLLPFISLRDFNVSTEVDFGTKGRVDINIISKNFWLIIEAKINAGEQMNQLERYNRILSINCSDLGIDPDFAKVFYLTLYGSEPETGRADKCISWGEISEIMSEYAKQANNGFVRELARQYSEYLKCLVGEYNG